MVCEYKIGWWPLNKEKQCYIDLCTGPISPVADVSEDHAASCGDEVTKATDPKHRTSNLCSLSQCMVNGNKW